MLKVISFLILFVCAYAGISATVDTVVIHSDAMNKNLKAIVVVPDKYANSKDQFNVVYLLHGYTGNYQDWITKAPVLKTLSDKYQIIYVCPDGANSWYIDSPVNKKSQYETYVGSEVVSWTDSHYRTIKKPSGRAITGLSMGGYGALYIGMKHSDSFGAAGSMSGGVDLCFKPKSFEKSKVLGEFTANTKRWSDYSIANVLNQLRGRSLAIIFDCGESDFFIENNRALDKKMTAKGIAHQYTERAGGHTWEYWNESIQSQTQFFANFFSEK